MQKLILYIFVLLLCFSLGATAVVFVETLTAVKSVETNSISVTLEPTRMPQTQTCYDLEFSIVNNDLYSSKIRHVELFLDPNAFNEKNLRRLFSCVSRDNPEPAWLTVQVETDWSRVHLPTGRPGTGSCPAPPDPHEYDFLQALYWRRENHEYFRYSPGIHIHQFYFKTVVIRGKRPR